VHDGLIRSHELVERAVDDHNDRTHYANGAELVDDFAAKQRRLPKHAPGRSSPTPILG
jgi:hypothetical protein